jgi:hypothetical protein
MPACVCEFFITPVHFVGLVFVQIGCLFTLCQYKIGHGSSDVPIPAVPWLFATDMWASRLVGPACQQLNGRDQACQGIPVLQNYWHQSIKIQCTSGSKFVALQVFTSHCKYVIHIYLYVGSNLFVNTKVRYMCTDNYHEYAHSLEREKDTALSVKIKSQLFSFHHSGSSLWDTKLLDYYYHPRICPLYGRFYLGHSLPAQNQSHPSKWPPPFKHRWQQIWTMIQHPEVACLCSQNFEMMLLGDQAS